MLLSSTTSLETSLASLSLSNTALPPVVHREIPEDVVFEIIRQTDDQRTLAAWCRVSFAHLKIAGPTLYHSVRLGWYSVRAQWSIFLADYRQEFPPQDPAAPLPSFSGTASRIFPALSRHQTKHLLVSDPPDYGSPSFGAQSSRAARIFHRRGPTWTLLNLKTLADRLDSASCWTGLSPQTVVLGLRAGRKPPMTLGEVAPVIPSPPNDLYFSPHRLEEVIFSGFYALEESFDSASWHDRNVRLTMDLSMIKQARADPLNPKASYQRLLRAFTETSEASGGRQLRRRVWVCSEAMKEKFEIAREALRTALPLIGETVLADHIGQVEIEVTEDTRTIYGPYH